MKELKQGYWSRVRKGTDVSAERKVGECFQWKANGQCSKGNSCCFNHGSHSGQRAQSSSSTSRAPTQTDGRKPYRCGSPRGASSSGLKGKRPCKKNSEERAQNRRVTSGTLPCVKITCLNLDASMVTSVIIYTLRLVRKDRSQGMHAVDFVVSLSLSLSDRSQTPAGCLTQQV